MSRNSIAGLTLVGTLCLCHAAGAQALDTRFDVDAADAPAEETQPGFVRCTEASISGGWTTAPLPLAGADCLASVTVAGTGPVETGFRDRGIGAMLDTYQYKNVLRDFVKQNGPEAEITVTIADLPCGVYDITTFHHDWNVWSIPGQVFDIYVDDAQGGNQLKVDDGVMDATNPYLGEKFQVESDGVNDIVMRIVPDPMADVQRAKFNGMMIEVPTVCASDFDGDGSVGFSDLSKLLADWGPCQ